MLILLNSLIMPIQFILLGIGFTALFRGGMKTISLGVAYLLGINIVGLAILLNISLNFVSFFSALLAVMAVIYVIVKRREMHIKIRWLSFLLLLIAAIPIINVVVFDPLIGWDARSIWFFHGKMIFFQGALTQDAGLQNPATYAHSDYPKLVPSLSAFVAHQFGYWNEYIPKLSVYLLLLGVILILSETSFPRKIWSILLMFFMMLLPYPLLIIYGYVDIWLAIYSFLALWSMVNYYNFGKTEDLTIGMLCTLLLPQMKNEGLLLALIIISNFLMLQLLFLRKELIGNTFSVIRKYWYKIALSISPVIIWIGLKHLWKLPNDLNLFTEKSWQLFNERLNSDAMLLIYNNFLKQPKVDTLAIMAALCYIITMIYLLRSKAEKVIIARFNASFLLLFGSAVLYVLSMYYIYMATPFELKWHLSTSADRTVLPIISMLALTIFPALSVKRYERNIE